MRHSGLLVASGADVTVPKLTLLEDDTAGLYIRKLEVPGAVAKFAATELVRFQLWNASTGATVTLDDAADFTVTQSTVEATGVITLTITLVSYANITLTITLTPQGDSYRAAQTLANTNATYGVEWWEFPRLGCKPDSGTAANAYLANGWLGGLVMIDPHLAEITETLLGSPPAMQFTDYYDSETKLHVYVQTNDATGYHKGWGAEGDGTNCVQFWRHHPKNPRKAGNNSAAGALTYNVDICVFRGKTEDGRCGFYDSAIRYRDWAITQTWTTDRGAWADSADVPDRVKDSDFYIVEQAPVSGATATYWTDTVEDVRRVKDFIGATDCLMLMYGWDINQGALVAPPTFRPPDFTPPNFSADLNTALGTCGTQSIHASYYTIPHPWDTTLNDPADGFAYTQFLGQNDYGAISQYVIKDETDAVETSNSLAYLDVAQNLATLKAIIKDVHSYDGTAGGGGAGATNIGYYTQTLNPPEGWYYDLFGGGGVLFNYATAINPNGNTGGWEANKKELSDYLRDQMRLLDADFYISTENCEEHLIPVYDIFHIGQIGVNTDLRVGMFMGSFGIVYSRFIALYDLGITLNIDAFIAAPVLSSQWQFFLSWVVWSWHQTGGHVCLTNGFPTAIVPVDPPTILNCPLYALLVGMKRLIERMGTNTAIKTYMNKGFRLRPLPASWEGDFLDDGSLLSLFHAENVAVPARLCASSVWKNASSNDIGIVITSTHQANLTYNIYMRAEAYDLSPNQVKILYQNVDGVRTEITRFTDILDQDVTLTFDGGGPAVDLYEVVMA